MAYIDMAYLTVSIGWRDQVHYHDQYQRFVRNKLYDVM